MFDFFCRFSIDSSGLPELQSPFLKINAYSILDFKTTKISQGNSSWILLSRKKNNWQCFYSDAHISVFIYGYLFLKALNKTEIDKRFTALDVKNWILSGKKIDTEHFKGAYSILINDHEKNTFTIITDPLNTRFVMYCKYKEAYLFSSSLDAIIAFMREDHYEPRLNSVALIQQYLLDFILDEETFIEGVHIVPPAHILSVDNMGLKFEKYWDLFNEFRIEKPYYSPRKGVKIIDEYLKKHVKNYIDTPENTAIALTGGYDSRTLIALLGKKAKAYSFFSYGSGNSWDMRIPRKIAEENEFNFQSYLLDNDFETEFEQNVELALSLSHGMALFTQANIPYIYYNFFRQKTSILTGLFGSELIKYPSGRGLFVNEAMLSLLLADSPRITFEKLLKRLPDPVIEQLQNMDLREKLISSVIQHPVIANKYKIPEKFFYYMIMIGTRKYFAREIAMERPFVDNLHPFWDVDFIKLLLKTPYSWVHFAWSNKKNYFINLKLHQIYAKLIYRNNKKLSLYISSHATRPIFLTHILFIPFLAFDYIFFRKKIKNATVLYPGTFENGYVNLVSKTLPENNITSNPAPFEKRALYKMISINQWCEMNKIEPFSL